MNIIRLFAICVILLSSSPSYAYLFDMSDSDKVKSVLDRADQMLSGLVGKAGFEARETTAFAVRRVISLIATMRGAYAADLEKTMGALDGQRRAAFDDLKATIEAFGDELSGNIDQLSLIEQRASATMLSVALWADKTPVVFGYSPGTIRLGSVNTVTVTINGRFLSEAERPRPPTLRIGTQSTDAATALRDRLDFAVPLAWFNKSSEGKGVAVASLELTLPSGLLGLSESKTITSPLLFSILPESIGTYVAEFRLKSRAIEKRQGRCPSSGEYGITSAIQNLEETKCCRPRDMDDGWRFVINSVNFITTQMTGTENNVDFSHELVHGSFFGPAGRSFQQGVNEDEICTLLFVRPNTRKTRGYVEGHVDVQEVRIVESEDWRQLATGSVKPGRDETIDIPASATAWRVTFNGFDDSREVFIRSERGELVSVDAEAGGRVLRIRPELR